MIGLAGNKDDEDDDPPVATGSEPSNASDDSKRDVMDDVVDVFEAVEELRGLVTSATTVFDEPSWPVTECSSPF